MFLIVSKVTFVFRKKTKDGKKRKDVKASEGDTFKKRSIFFKYLPYWKDLDYDMRSMVCMSRRMFSIA